MELNKLNQKLNAGSTFIIKEGEYSNDKIKITSSGTKENPITILSEDNVIITGTTTLRIIGSHIIFTGFTFRDINVNKAIKLEGNNIQFTRNVVEGLKKDVEWILGVYGEHIRIDNNVFRSFDKMGVIIVLWVKPITPLFCLIDKNTFNNRKSMDKKNGAEMIRIGDSKTSLFESKSTIYDNNFNMCCGEIEIISVKSCKNVIYNNKFMNCEGGLCFRHGKDNLAAYNYFIGNNELSAGIRITDTGHKIFFNTFENIKNEEPFRSALSIMNGEFNNKLNGYAPVKDCVVKYNDFLECENAMSIGVVNKRRSNIKPKNIDIRHNRFIKTRGMFNSSGKGAEDSRITDNKIMKYDQKLNIETAYKYDSVDIETFYYKLYTKNFESKDDIVIESDEESEEKYPHEKLDNLVNQREVVIIDAEEDRSLAPSPVSCKLEEGLKDKLDHLRETFIELYETNKKRNESIKKIIDLLN